MKFVAITNEAFVPGLVTLAYSMRRFFRPELIVLTFGELSEASQAQLARLDVPMEFVPIAELGEFRLRRDQTIPGRLDVSLQKILIWRLPEAGPCCYLDVDLLCVGDPSGLCSMPAFTSTMVFGITLPRSVCGRPMFSGGMFVFQPSEERFGEIQDWSLSFHGQLPLADQTLLNHFMYERHPDEVHLLGIEWETIKRIKVRHPELWPNGRSKFIHYVGLKPWDARAESESGYAGLVRLWRDAYRDATA